MAIGAINRKALRAAVYVLVDAATGATRLEDRITLEAAPEGREHAYYAVETFDDSDTATHRGSGIAEKRHTLTLRLAFSLARYVHDQDAGRDAADDAIDDLERSLYQPAAGQVAQLANLDVTAFRKRERLHASREWLIYDLLIEVLAGFDLAA